jgi:hypothetical protein
VLLLALLLQTQAPAPAPDTVRDSVYATAALRDFVARAAIQNRAPPLSLTGYDATVETELALILRDSLGREAVGQIEQLAAQAAWERSGRYELHVVGFRSQSLGAPYSALTFTRMYTVPTLYGNRLFVGMNDGLPRTRADTVAARRRMRRDTAAGRDRFRAIHPLAFDRDGFYRFTGGDTVATMYSLDRVIRVVRVEVTAIKGPTSNFVAFVGELDFDADRHQLVRMRGRLENVTTAKDPFMARRTGAVAIAYLEFENAEINGRYWLPNYERSEFQAQMGLLGDVRPIYRIVSRFRNYRLHETGDTVVALGEMDTIPRTQAKLTFAARDSVSGYREWTENLGTASGRVGSEDFNDLAPDVWRSEGSPRVDYWPRRLEDIVRYNRVEGMFTGLAGMLRFRDMAPGLSAQAHAGVAWEQQTARGAAALAYTRGNWIHSARVERSLATTNDFLLAFDNGLSIGPLISGVDDNDYVDRWTGAVAVTRVMRDIDRALMSTELAYGRDAPEIARLKNGVFASKPFRPNRAATGGSYVRSTSKLEWHPKVNGETLTPGFGARFTYEFASGDLDWQRIEARLAARRYWRGIVFASRVDAGAILGSVLPPQTLYELGGTFHLPSYEYKEFGGDRAAIGRALAAYHLPILRAPLRLRAIVLPGLSPGIGAGVQGGWTEASSQAAQTALQILGSTPTGRVRATADLRFTILSGALGAGVARPIDQSGKWKPFFVWGASF